MINLEKYLLAYGAVGERCPFQTNKTYEVSNSRSRSSITV